MALVGLEAALVYGVVQGMLLGMVSQGLGLIWGVMKVINLAHGEFIVLGAYLTIALARVLGLDPLLSPLLEFGVGFVLGLAVFYTILYKLIGRAETITLREEMATLLAMFGLAIFMYKLFFLAADRTEAIKLYDSVPEIGFYSSLGTLSIMGVSVEGSKIYVALASLAVTFMLHLFLDRTLTGIAIRAVAQDAVAVSLVGANPVRAKAIATGLGIGLTVMSGGLVALYHSTGIAPGLSHIYAPLSFAIVVLGSPGHVWGTMLAGILMGLVISLMYAFTGSLSLSTAVAFIVLVITLAVRPEGLFARR